MSWWASLLKRNKPDFIPIYSEPVSVDQNETGSFHVRKEVYFLFLYHEYEKNTFRAYAYGGYSPGSLICGRE